MDNNDQVLADNADMQGAGPNEMKKELPADEQS